MYAAALMDRRHELPVIWPYSLYFITNYGNQSKADFQQCSVNISGGGNRADSHSTTNLITNLMVFEEVSSTARLSAFFKYGH